MITIAPYESFKRDHWQRRIDLERDPLALMLLDADYSPRLMTDSRREDIRNREILVGGYNLGGEELSGVWLEKADDGTYLHANGLTWQFARSAAVRYAVIYAKNGGELVALIDFSETLVLPALDLHWHEKGILKL